MSQLLKKFALLTACAVLALCFATRPAQAQMVDASGTGEHLLFAYWSTANYMNTQVAVRSPLGVRNSGETMNVVRIKVRDTMGESLADFNVCLTPGDSWTAVLSSEGLMVGDPGGCDDAVAQPAASTDRDGGNGMMATPMSGEMMPLGADGGYFEAWINPVGTLADDTIACSNGDAATGSLIPETGGSPSSETCRGQLVGDFDADGLAENATPRNISGMAFLVSSMSGFSSSYNATALTGCGNRAAVADAAVTIAAALGTDNNDGTLNHTETDDGNACWHVLAMVNDEPAEGDSAGAPITAALMVQDRDLLTGRWVAIKDENITSHTKVVLTFPVNQLGYEGIDADGEDVEGTDPVTVIAFDDTGQVALQEEAMLDMNVNMCRFMSAGMDMGDDMDMDDGMPMLSCNGEMVAELDVAPDKAAGEFRIFNNTVDAQVASTTDSTPADGIPTNEPNYVSSDGAETAGLGVQNAVDDATDMDDDAPAGGQVPAEALNAIGLVFTYFMGTDGQEYDQASPIQWISVPTLPAADTDASDGVTPAVIPGL